MYCSVLYTVCYLSIDGLELSGVRAGREVMICSEVSRLPNACALCRIGGQRDNIICGDLDIAVRHYTAHLTVFNCFGKSTCVPDDHGFTGSPRFSYHKATRFGPVWQVNKPAKVIHERRNVIVQARLN